MAAIPLRGVSQESTIYPINIDPNQEVFLLHIRATLDALGSVLPRGHLDHLDEQMFLDPNCDLLRSAVEHIDHEAIEHNRANRQKAVEGIRRLFGLGVGMGVGVIAGPWTGAAAQLLVQGDVRQTISKAKNIYQALYDSGLDDDIMNLGYRLAVDVVDTPGGPPVPPPSRCCNCFTRWFSGWGGAVSYIGSTAYYSTTLVFSSCAIYKARQELPLIIREALGILPGEEYAEWLPANIAELREGREVPDYVYSSPLLKKYLSPMTFLLIQDPVLAPNGTIYERRNIEMWLINRPTSPIKNTFPMSIDQLQELPELREQILLRLSQVELEYELGRWKEENALKLRMLQVANHLVLDEEMRMHICPLSKEVIRDPLKGPDERVYERTVITMWLEDHTTSPFDPTVDMSVDQLEEMPQLAKKIRNRIKLLELLHFMKT